MKTKKFTDDDIKDFLKKFITLFDPNAKLLLYVTSKKTGNKFWICIMINENLYAVKKSPAENCVSWVNANLNKIFMKANPYIMLRDNLLINIDTLVNRFHCDEHDILNSILKALKNAQRSAKFFNAIPITNDDIMLSSTPIMNSRIPTGDSFEEFLMNIDLLIGVV